MVYNKVYFKLSLRVILLLVSCVAFGFVFGKEEFFFTSGILGILIIFQSVEALNFLNRSNRQLVRFLTAIRNGDFTLNYNIDNKSGNYRRLYGLFNELSEQLKQQRSEKAASELFLKAIIDELDIGILVMNANREISLVNESARKLLNIPDIVRWELLQSSSRKTIEELLQLRPERTNLLEKPAQILSVKRTDIKVLEHKHIIFSLKDIRSEVQTKELEAWHRMVRVLTHEIMNSMTPMSSLSDTLELILTGGGDETKSTLNREEIEDLREGVQTLGRRSRGIMNFVVGYRKLTKIAQRELKTAEISALINHAIRLYTHSNENPSATISCDIEHIKLEIDELLIEQAIINLLKNAAEAADQDRPLTVEVIGKKISPTRFLLTIKDNGVGIPEDKLRQVMVPFFTTKKSGTGIGLPLSRQIMELHGGLLQIESQPGKGTTIDLYFAI
jgi:nitrogen fixation/metabolism regulation signal transduction histidine kinase